jgi:long-chain acyl-CoA synthetase
MPLRYLEGPSEAGTLDGWCIPGLLRDRSLHHPNAPAVRFKQRGIYHQLTWKALWAQVSNLSSCFENMGLASGDRVGVMAGPEVRAIVAEHAVWATGAISVGIYPSASVKDILHILQDSTPTLLVIGRQEHLDRIAELANHLHSVKAIVVLNADDVDVSVGSVKIVRLDYLLAEPSGRRSASTNIAPDAIACITYTSGTTGRAKGVMHSHRSLIYAGDCKRILVPALLKQEQRTIISVPFTHISPKCSAILIPLISFLVPSLPESPDSVRQTIIDTQPTYIVQPPRFYEKVVQDVTRLIEAAGGIRHLSYEYAMKIAEVVVKHRWEGRKAPLRYRVLYAVARALIFRPILNNFGYGHLRHGYVGSAPCSPALVLTWHCWGLDLRESYGLTESGGNITGQQTSFPRPGNIGHVLRRSDYQIRIANDGELIFKGPSNFIGYWNEPTASKRTLVDGWVHTGDLVAEAPDGSIVLVGRKSQVIVTTGGKTLNPESIETALKNGRFVAEAVAIGHGRQFVAAIIEPEMEQLALWARDRGIAVDNYQVLTQHPEVLALLAQEIERANSGLGRVERIRKFIVAPSPFSQMEGIYTSLQKIRREEVIRRFSTLIDALYVETADLKVG